MASLDLPDPQVLVYFPDDPAIGYHHRLLLRRIGGSSWIASSPDLELERIDLADYSIIALGRAAPVPSRVLGDVCLFDDFDDTARLEELRREANRMAALLGRGEATTEDVGGSDPTWLVADTAHPRFGEPVDEEVAANAGTSRVEGAVGIVKLSGDDGWTFMERVSADQVVQWREQKHVGPGRDRCLNVPRRDAEGRGTARWRRR